MLQVFHLRKTEMLLYFKDEDDLHHMQVQKERKKKKRMQLMG